MKKKVIITGLMAIIISCGGGGGSGSPTNQPTPHNGNSSNSTQNTEKNTTNTENINNIPNASNPKKDNTEENNSNKGIGHNDNSGKKDENRNQFPKPENIDGKLLTGYGVKLGILDSDFLSEDAKTENLHGKLKDGFLVNPTFKEVIEQEFEGRLTAEPRVEGKLSKDEHGLMVTTIMAGKSGKGATESQIYAVSISNGKGFLIEEEKYRQLQREGVRIYNQSFGTALEFTEHKRDYREKLASLTLKENEIEQSVLLKRVDALLNFYKEAVNEGSLFIWAAGNTVKDKTMNNPTIEGGLPAYISELRKGWITVVGVSPDKKEYNKHLARAGEARYWSISADGSCGLPGCGITGSSFAAPKVTAVAAKVSQRFPWMTGHEIQQTILTTAEDIGAVGIDTVFGWGYLDEEKALKGPAEFNNILLVGENADKAGARGKFNANIGKDIISIFENNIKGDGGLEKNGKGTLILTGKNTYMGDTLINEGNLEVYGLNGSNMTIEEKGTLVLFPEARIGLEGYYGMLPKNVQNNGGTLINMGTGATITGNYNATEGSKTMAEIGKNLIVEGKMNLQGKNSLYLISKKYISSKNQDYRVIEANSGIEGTFDKVVTPELVNGTLKMENNAVLLSVSRKNVTEYVENLELSDKMRVDAAENIETAFSALDKKLEEGKADQEFLKSASLLQQMPLATSAQILDSLSGQIYASAQALTFQQSRGVNRDLSNRLVMLGTLDKEKTETGFWSSVIGSDGKLKKEGFGTGKTSLHGSQIGIDRKIGNNLIIGTAFSYSKAKAKFNRYGGKSESENYGISLYGRWDNKNIPYYLQGRIGTGNVSSKVERDIILGIGSKTGAKISHKDRVYSGYLETGYNFRKGNFTITPFGGLSYDTVKRGAFSEENSQFGLTAEEKKYNQTKGIIGLRTGYSFDSGKGSRTALQGYVIYEKAFKKQDLSFEASYTGLQDAKFRVKGIGLSESSMWTGVGVLTEFSPKFAWYANYDLQLEKNKGHNNVFTTGIRVGF